MQVSAKSVMLEQYNKLLKNDTSTALQTAKEAANPLLIGKSDSSSSSSSSALDTVQISQQALNMLANYTSDDASVDEARKAALEKLFQFNSSDLSSSGNTNLEAILAAIEENFANNETSTILETMANVNREANAGKGHLSYDTDLGKLLK